MEEKEKIIAVSKFYMCDFELAEKIIKSAELNNIPHEIERITKDYIMEKSKNAN